MTSRTQAIMSRSLFKRRGFLTGMTYTGQNKHLNYNGDISPLNRNAEPSLPEIPEEKPEPEAAPVNPPAENPEPGNSPEEKDDSQDGEKPSE